MVKHFTNTENIILINQSHLISFWSDLKGMLVITLQKQKNKHIFVQQTMSFHYSGKR